MPLLIHSGVAASDLAASGTKRDDISDVLLASLYFENNMLGLTTVGEEFVDEQLKWVEDALNQYKVTDTTGGGQSAVSTVLTLSLADNAVLDLGTLLQRDSQVGIGEIVMVTGFPSTTTTTISRGYGGTTATTDGGAPQVWRVINAPTYQNSDLGKDLTRARISKNNWINRFELNVNIDSEQIARSRNGYAPGIQDELQYQFKQRLLELKRKMQNAYWFSVAGAGTTGGDYATMHGLFAWLNGTANASSLTGVPPAFNSTAEPLTDTVINTMVKGIYRNGGNSNVLVGGINVTEKISLLYTDRMRSDFNDRNRGFFAQHFTPTMANEHRIVTDAYLNDVSGVAQLLILDMSRIRIRPFVGQMFYTINSPSFRDGDAVRALSKWSLEVRNSGSDVGNVHALHTNLTI